MSRHRDYTIDDLSGAYRSGGTELQIMGSVLASGYGLTNSIDLANAGLEDGVTSKLAAGCLL